MYRKDVQADDAEWNDRGTVDYVGYAERKAQEYA